MSAGIRLARLRAWLAVLTALSLTIVAPAQASAAHDDVLHGNVGFFASAGVPVEIVPHVSFSLINAASPDQVRASLAATAGSPFRVKLDVGPVLKEQAITLRSTYRTSGGDTREKTLAPLPGAKVKQLPSDARIREVLGPYLDVLAAHRDNVGTIFVADEPYLNGISRAQMERAGRVVREELDARGLTSVKLGVIFASGMFDARFARMLDARAGDYAHGIDAYHASGEAPPEWLSVIETVRLTTYDQAGNMYTGGGIPEGFDVVGFNLYVATVLLDRIHDGTLAWFAEHTEEPACKVFADVTMTQVRERLSFFSDGPLNQDVQGRHADAALLDDVYHCRMRALTHLLRTAAAGSDAQLLLIGESSNNGLLEFTADGTPKQAQPALLVEGRVMDEVRRAMHFYDRQRFPAGLALFTYEDDHDASIKLDVGGASGMPSVMSAVKHYSRHGTLARE